MKVLSVSYSVTSGVAEQHFRRWGVLVPTQEKKNPSALENSPPRYQPTNHDWERHPAKPRDLWVITLHSLIEYH